MSLEDRKPASAVGHLEKAISPPQDNPPKQAHCNSHKKDEKMAHLHVSRGLPYSPKIHQWPSDQGLSENTTCNYNREREYPSGGPATRSGGTLQSVSHESCQVNIVMSLEHSAVYKPCPPYWGKEALPTKNTLFRSWCRFLTKYSPLTTAPYSLDGVSERLSVTKRRTKGSGSDRSSHPSSLQDGDRSMNNIAPFVKHVESGIMPVVVTTISGGEPNAATFNNNAPSKKVNQAERYLGSATIDGDLPALFYDELDMAEPNSKIISRVYGVTNVGVGHPDYSSSTNNCKPSPWHTEYLLDSIRALPTPVFSTGRGNPPLSCLAIPKKEDSNAPSQSSAKPLEDPRGTRRPDRIELLEMRRNILRRSITSVSAAIDRLTRVGNPSPVVHDVAAGENIKISVARLESELAGLRRDEHEVGIKLIRARKRRDENDFCGAGSTSLWVKRVTS